MIDTGIGIQGRDALLGEAEVIGPVVKPLLRLRIRPYHPTLGGGRRLQIIVQLRRAVADHGDVVHRTVGVEAVHVDGGHRLVPGIHWVGRVVRRAEQAFLLGRHRQEEYRARRSLFEGRVGLGQLQQAGDSGGVVKRAVVDPVALDGGVLPQVVPMGHVHYVLVGPIGARENCEHVPGRGVGDLVGETGAGPKAHRYGLEFPNGCLGLQLVEVHAGLFEDLVSGVMGYPALHRHP